MEVLKGEGMGYFQMPGGRAGPSEAREGQGWCGWCRLSMGNFFTHLTHWNLLQRPPLVNIPLRCRFCLQRMRGSHSFPVSTQKSQVIEIHKCEKHFKETHKESHKVEVLTRIYFSITG
jgi:hypothetical protein